MLKWSPPPNFVRRTKWLKRAAIVAAVVTLMIFLFTGVEYAQTGHIHWMPGV